MGFKSEITVINRVKWQYKIVRYSDAKGILFMDAFIVQYLNALKHSSEGCKLPYHLKAEHTRRLRIIKGILFF